MILYFSGTGNSEYVAERIAADTEDAVLSLNELIRDGDHHPLHSEKPWVIVAPTYAWRLPRIVRDWLLETEVSGNRKTYFVLTCGDGAGNAGSYAQALCREKGLEYCGLMALVMPENYIAMFNAPEEEEAKKIIRAAEPRITVAASRIKKEEKFSEKRSLPGVITSGLINPLFYSMFIKDRAFKVSDACVGCGLCESLCPLNNIRLENNRPAWNGNCTHCMACICHCPEKAIEYGRASAGKPRYTCPPM